MNRDNLDFLQKMFKFTHFSDFSILIINQTTENKLLYSEYKSVRIINSFEKGLSKSRNLGIENANAELILITDDDVEFIEGFDEIIIDAFKKNSKAHLISFKNIRIGELESHNKSKVVFKHNFKTIESVCSIEIAFRLNSIKEKKISFNENFGLGSYFETGEEYLFLIQIIKQQLDAYFYPAAIVKHAIFSSGKAIESNKLMYARAALFKETKGVLGIIWMYKYLFFLKKKKHIKFTNCFEKHKIGLLAIKKHKELTKKD